ERMPGRTALERAGIDPARLQAKEGLALLNGTQALTAVGALALWRATRLAGRAVPLQPAHPRRAPAPGPGARSPPPAVARGSERCRPRPQHRPRPGAGR